MTPEHRDVPGQAPDNVSTVSRARDLFSVPAPIKRIFDRFPLVTYPSNDLPHSAWSDKRGNRLYVFTDAAGARHGRPSFNPQCLKWQVRTRKCSIAPVLKYITNLIPLCVSLQAYLRFVGIDVDVIPSNNHASPSGALPFLIPAHPINNNAPIPSSKLQKWAIEQVHCEEEQQLDLRFEVYASLLDHRIRNAWVRCGPPTPRNPLSMDEF